MECDRCGHINPDHAKFCGGCGMSFQPVKKKKSNKSIGIVMGVVAILLLTGIVIAFLCNLIGKNDAKAQAECKRGHQNTAATCTLPERCAVCGNISAPPLGHQWVEATTEFPQYCMRCGVMSGGPAKNSGDENVPQAKPAETTSPAVTPVYINEMGINGGINGRIWTRSDREAEWGFEFTNEDAPECWSYFDTGVNGHTPGHVFDNYGNEYTYGIHIDGAESEEYFFGYYTEDKYTTFSGTVACPEKSKAISSYVYKASTAYTKYFEVYGDDVLLYTSPPMRYDYPPVEFSVDITGVEVVTIVYPATNGPNEIATIYDGRFS